MKHLPLFCLLVLLAVFSLFGCHADAHRPTWVHLEDNGDKPGIELRVTHDAKGNLQMEEWIYVKDMNELIKQRRKLPHRVDKSTPSVIAWTLLMNDGAPPQSCELVFPEGLSRDQENAVLTFSNNGGTRDYVFVKAKS